MSHISNTNSNFTRKEASTYLQEKLFGLPSALQHTIFEAVSRIEHGGYDVQKVLDWYHKIEKLYNNFEIQMRAKIENINGVDYLSFTPEGMRFPTQIPVITSGSRDEANAWTWNGSLETPTVRPSVRTQYANEKGEMVMIHYWLNDGVCQCLSDCTDGNAGKNIALTGLSS